MSVITLMAAALKTEMARRNIVALDLTPVTPAECEEIISAVIAATAAIAQTYEASRPGPQPPDSRAPDGGCIAPGDMSAVDLSGDVNPREEGAK